MSNTNSIAVNRDHGASLKIVNMTDKQFLEQSNPFFRGHVGKSNNAAMRNIFYEDECSEIGIDNHENPLLPGSPLKQRQITGIRSKLTSVNHIVPAGT